MGAKGLERVLGLCTEVAATGEDIGGDEDGCKGWEGECPVSGDGFPGVDMEDDVFVPPRLGALPTSRECGAKGEGFFVGGGERLAEPVYLRG